MKSGHIIVASLSAYRLNVDHNVFGCRILLEILI